MMKNKYTIIAICVVVAILICAGIVIIGTSGKKPTSGNSSQSEMDHSQGVDDTHVDENKGDQNNTSNNSEDKDTSSDNSEGGLNVEQNGNGESVDADDIFGDDKNTETDNKENDSSNDKNDTTVDTEKDTTADSEEDTTSESEEGLPDGDVDTEQGWGPLM